MRNGLGRYKIIYFSGTGNSEYVALELKKKLAGAEAFAVDSLWAACARVPGDPGDKNSMASKLDGIIPEGAYLVLVYPTYASDIPKPLKEALQLFPKRRRVELAVVSTCAMTGGDACLIPARMLKRRGYRLTYASYVKMPSNFKIPPMDQGKIETGEELDKYIGSSARETDKITGDMVSGRKIITGRGMIALLLGAVQRRAEKFMDNMINKNMFADNTCIKCGLCVSSCPMGNITYKNGHPDFGGNCCYCLRCYSFCPAYAIQVTEKTKDKLKYTRYSGFNKWSPKRLYKV